jgi:hypothetical protein
MKLKSEGLSVSYHQVVSLIRKKGLIRSSSDRTKLMQFDTRRNCRHCKQEYTIINTAQVYCRVCCPSENRKAYLRLKLYDLSHPEFESLLISQNGLCAICDNPLKDKGATGLNVDHCRSTGKVRGILCHRCNIVVGFLDKGDWQKSVEKVISYISRNK